MFTITYERSYHGQRDATAVPPDELVRKAEKGAAMLHPARAHIFCAEEPRLELHHPPLRSSIGWYVRYEPKETI